MWQQNSGRANHFNLPALRFHRGVPDALHDFFSATAVAVSDPVFWHHSSGVVHQVQYHRDNQCIESLDDALGKEDYYRLISLIIKILIILKKMV